MEELRLKCSKYEYNKKAKSICKKVSEKDGLLSGILHIFKVMFSFPVAKRTQAPFSINMLNIFVLQYLKFLEKYERS